jgi:ArsR family transcriptional regulator
MNDWAALAGLDVHAAREFPSDSKDRGLTVCLWHLGDRSKTE